MTKLKMTGFMDEEASEHGSFIPCLVSIHHV